jgi:hypothetical protein
MTLWQKYPTQNRAGRVSQVVQYLPSRCEALSSNPSTGKKKKRKERRKEGRNGLIQLWKLTSSKLTSWNPR